MPKAPTMSTKALNTLRNVSGAVAQSYVGLFSVLPANDVWTLTQTTGANAATGGTFTLTFGAQTTTALAWNSTAAQVAAALQVLSSMNAGDVIVTGANGQADAQLPGDALVITLVGALGLTANGNITKSDSLTGGTTPANTLTHTITGTAGTEFTVANGYARSAVTFSAPTGINMTNSGGVNVGPSTAAWSGSPAVGWGVWDASSAGNLLYWDALVGVLDQWNLWYTFTTAPTGGTFTLSLTGTAGNEIGTTTAIPWNADALTVQAALEEMAGTGNVQVRRASDASGTTSALPNIVTAAGGMLITFIGALRWQSNALSVGTSSLTGGTGSPTAVTTHAVTGSNGNQAIGAANITVTLNAGAIVISEV